MIEGPISVVAPCGPYPPDRFAEGVRLAEEELGVRLVLPSDLQAPWRYLASDDAHRLAQLEAAFRDPDTAAVWIARGGFGLTRILPRLDAALTSAKPLIGFSDATALHAARWLRGAGPGIHAPVVNSLPITAPGDRRQLAALLSGEAGNQWATDPWLPGIAEGPLLGGNLCLLAALCGTPWQLDVRGAVLVLEDIGEAPYRIDRMLQQLLAAGGLDGVAAIVVGELEGCKVPIEAGFTHADLFRDVLGDLGAPLVGGAPVGHGARNQAFLWGSPARVTPQGVDIGSG
ncbi:MAG: LD-carboxypeptidase [Deltaproteobacteria bacterium]|nr:LD-carboxypeptidase [Deltaproteobacteria bacterium]